MNSENKSCERWFYITSGLLKDKLYSFARSYASLVVLVPSSAFLIKSDCRFCFSEFALLLINNCSYDFGSILMSCYISTNKLSYHL